MLSARDLCDIVDSLKSNISVHEALQQELSISEHELVEFVNSLTPDLIDLLAAALENEPFSKEGLEKKGISPELIDEDILERANEALEEMPQEARTSMQLLSVSRTVLLLGILIGAKAQVKGSYASN